MEHFFDLPIMLNEKDLSFPCRMVSFGYGYKFHVIIDKQEIIFERDDAMEYRAINLDPAHKSIPDRTILEAIVISLKKLSGQ